MICHSLPVLVLRNLYILRHRLHTLLSSLHLLSQPLVFYSILIKVLKNKTIRYYFRPALTLPWAVRPGSMSTAQTGYYTVTNSVRSSRSFHLGFLPEWKAAKSARALVGDDKLPNPPSRRCGMLLFDATVTCRVLCTVLM